MVPAQPTFVLFYLENIYIYSYTQPRWYDSRRWLLEMKSIVWKYSEKNNIDCHGFSSYFPIDFPHQNMHNWGIPTTEMGWQLSPTRATSPCRLVKRNLASRQQFSRNGPSCHGWPGGELPLKSFKNSENTSKFNRSKFNPKQPVYQIVQNLFMSLFFLSFNLLTLFFVSRLWNMPRLTEQSIWILKSSHPWLITVFGPIHTYIYIYIISG